MSAALWLLLVAVALVANFALKQWLDHDMTVRRGAPDSYGWTTMWPVLGLITWLSVRKKYPVRSATPGPTNPPS